MSKFNYGFTLVELMVVIAIIAVTLSFAVPGFRNMFARNQVAVQVNDVLLAVNLARSEALRRRARVSLLAVDGSDADDEFGNGYCIYLDAADPATDSCSDAGVVARVFPALAGDSTLNSVENDKVIVFSGLGGVQQQTDKNLDLCLPGQDGRRIHITLIGRSKSHRPEDGDAAKRPAC